MRPTEQVKKDIMELVSRYDNRRVRPHEIEKEIRRQWGDSSQTIKQALVGLVAEGLLVYSYRDPCSYIEVPPH